MTNGWMKPAFNYKGTISSSVCYWMRVRNLQGAMRVVTTDWMVISTNPVQTRGYPKVCRTEVKTLRIGTKTPQSNGRRKKLSAPNDLWILKNYIIPHSRKLTRKKSRKVSSSAQKKCPHSVQYCKPSHGGWNKLRVAVPNLKLKS